MPTRRRKRSRTGSQIQLCPLRKQPLLFPLFLPPALFLTQIRTSYTGPLSEEIYAGFRVLTYRYQGVRREMGGGEEGYVQLA